MKYFSGNNIRLIIKNETDLIRLGKSAVEKWVKH